MAPRLRRHRGAVGGVRQTVEQDAERPLRVEGSAVFPLGAGQLRVRPDQVLVVLDHEQRVPARCVQGVEDPAGPGVRVRLVGGDPGRVGAMRLIQVRGNCDPDAQPALVVPQVKEGDRPSVSQKNRMPKAASRSARRVSARVAPGACGPRKPA